MNPKRLFSPILAVVAAVLIGLAALAPQADAAVQNFAVGTGVEVEVLPFHISGQYTANTTAVVRFAIPFKARLVGASATARASGGTTPTLTVDVLEAGVTVLSAPISVTAGTVSEGTITDADLADEAVITVNLAIGGTSPTWNDITVLLTVVRQ